MATTGFDPRTTARESNSIIIAPAKNMFQVGSCFYINNTDSSYLNHRKVDSVIGNLPRVSRPQETFRLDSTDFSWWSNHVLTTSQSMINYTPK